MVSFFSRVVLFTGLANLTLLGSLACLFSAPRPQGRELASGERFREEDGRRVATIAKVATCRAAPEGCLLVVTSRLLYETP